MRYFRVQVTLKFLFVAIAVVAAYLAGIVSNRALLIRARVDADLARKELRMARQQAQLDEVLQAFALLTASDEVSREPLAHYGHLVRAYAHEYAPELLTQPSTKRLRELQALERNLWRELMSNGGGGAPISENPATP